MEAVGKNSIANRRPLQAAGMAPFSLLLNANLSTQTQGGHVRFKAAFVKQFLSLVLLIVAWHGVASANTQFSITVHGQHINSMSAPVRQAILNFVGETYAALPQRIRAQLQPSRFPIDIRFVPVSNQSPFSAVKCPVIEDMSVARALRQEFAAVAKQAGTNRIRYDGQLHTRVSKTRDRFVIDVNSGFLEAVYDRNGVGSQKLPCGHKDAYTLAKAALVHGFVRAFDNTSYDRPEDLALISGRGERNCRELSRSARDLPDQKELLLLNESSLRCLDLHSSSTVVSERKRYRVIGGGWNDGKPGEYNKTEFAVWPRAVNPFSFADDAQTHFAYHMEFFLLDPYFECRQPVIFEYFKQNFGDHFQSVRRGVCKVNTLMRVDTQDSTSGTTVVDLEYYDLNPQKVDQIYYYRAGSGDGIASAFGHSMYRVSSKPGQDILVGGCADNQFEANPDCDLVINHRANPMELRLDQGRAVFGGYPSQLLVAPVYDIMTEYGDSELRHIYRIPLGNKTARGFQPMNEPDKARFLYASLEQYWTYLGDYRFITNNCADEAMRLYQIASEHPGIQHANILTPRAIDQSVFDRLGLADLSVLEGIKETGFITGLWEKIFGKSQKRYLRQRRAVQDNDFVDESLRYTLYDAISDILELQDRRGKNGQPVNAEHISVIEREMKRWVQMATISNKKEDICRINAQYATTAAKIQRVDQILGGIKGEYQTLMNRFEAEYNRSRSREAWENMYKVNYSYYLALYHAEVKRMSQLGNLAVQMGYEIGYPNNGKDMLCKGNFAWRVTPQRREQVKRLIDGYSALDKSVQPYSRLSVAPGYGIPLENEVASGQMFRAAAQRRADYLSAMISNMSGELGMDAALYNGIRKMRRDLCVDRQTKRLWKDSAPNCKCAFNDVYNAEAALAAARSGQRFTPVDHCK